jgi:hypothetical protein
MALHTYALTTVERLKQYLRITVNTYDDELEFAINAATDEIERYCNRRFQETTYTNELYNGSGSAQLLLNNWPVSTTDPFSLGRRDTSLNQNSFSTIDGEFYFIDYDTGTLDLVGSDGFNFGYSDRFTRVPKYYRVTFTAGYAFDNTATFLSDVGLADVEMACKRVAAAIFKFNNTLGTLQSESIGDYSRSFGSGGAISGQEGFLTPDILSILSKHRRYFI